MPAALMKGKEEGEEGEEVQEAKVSEETQDVKKIQHQKNHRVHLQDTKGMLEENCTQQRAEKSTT